MAFSDPVAAGLLSGKGCWIPTASKRQAYECSSIAADAIPGSLYQLLLDSSVLAECTCEDTLTRCKWIHRDIHSRKSAEVLAGICGWDIM